MANHKIALSENSKIIFTNTSSINYDDVNDKVYINCISSSQITANNLSLGSQLIQTNSGSFSQVDVGSLAGVLLWNGNNWVSSQLLVQQYGGKTSRDLSGSYPNPKVVSVANVNSGSLLPANGGTGNNFSSSANSLLILSGSTFSTLNSKQNNSILCSINNKFVFLPPIYSPDVRFYTASADGTINTFTWTRPTGVTMMRVITCGGGGGGGRCYGTLSTTVGAGGGGGGLSDDIIYAPPYLTVTVGIGGRGGAASPTNTEKESVTSGGNSLVSYDNQILAYAGGGQAAEIYASSTQRQAAGGYGSFKMGGYGSYYLTKLGEHNVIDISSGGYTSGNNASPIINPTYTSVVTNKNFGYEIDSDGNPINIIFSAGSAYNTIYYTNSTSILYSDYSDKPIGFGAGGGGGWRNPTTGNKYPGRPGAHGFVLIAAW